jgi:signal transduction histidine kinase
MDDWEAAMPPAVPGGADERGDLATAVDLARRLVGCRRASLMLPDEGADELRIGAAAGLPRAVVARTRVRFGDPVSGLVAQTRQPLLVNGPQAGSFRRPARYHTGSYISVPVTRAGALWGVLNVADPIAGEGFGEEDLTTLQSLAAYIARDLEVPSIEQQVQQLQLRAIRAQEDERRRIARDLHDEAGHTLTAAIFRLDLDTVRLGAGVDADVAATLERARGALRECAATLHGIAFALQPRILEDLGLLPALCSLLTQAQAGSAAKITLTSTGRERPLGAERELALFRVAQEALTNARKHAQASQVRVRLAFAPRRVTLTVADDGVGLPDGAGRGRPGAHSGLGLVGMRERIAVLGGQFRLDRPPGGGTRLVAQLPIAPAKRQRD